MESNVYKGSPTKTQKSNIEHHKKTLETEITTNEIQEHEQQISVPENETTEDEIEVLEVIKESMNEEMYLNMTKETKSSNEFMNDVNDGNSGDEEESMGEIDNECYTFVKNTKTYIPEKHPVHEKEFCMETEPSSSNESKNDKYLAEENENNEDKSAKEVDNE